MNKTQTTDRKGAMKNMIYQPAASQQERDEFVAWLKTNQLTLKKYDSDELAWMAMQCGFSLKVICDVLSHWITDRKTRTTLSIRMAWYVDRELKSAAGEFSLKPQWEALSNKLLYDRDFDEAP